MQQVNTQSNNAPVAVQGNRVIPNNLSKQPTKQLSCQPYSLPAG